jgi:hypothetical protein
MIKALTLAAFLITSNLSIADEHSKTWHQLSILSQNVAYQIHMQGVDAESLKPEVFNKETGRIDTLLNQLVADGVLVEKCFQLKPELDIEDSLVQSVRALIAQHQDQYGVYVIREMLDVGARRLLSEYQEDAPVVLNVRLPKTFLEAFEVILAENGYMH